MKSVLISIQPKRCELIASGKKTIEVRKTRPKLKKPFKCYIYETKAEYKVGTGIFAYGIELQGTAKGRSKIIGEFVCDKVMNFTKHIGWLSDIQNYDISYDHLKETCLSCEELWEYGNGKELYGWHISDLNIYDKPKELGEFVRRGYPNCDECAHVPSGMHPQEFVWHNDFCGECTRLSYTKSMKGTHFRKRLTRAPQSWCYVEE